MSNHEEDLVSFANILAHRDTIRPVVQAIAENTPKDILKEVIRGANGLVPIAELAIDAIGLGDPGLVVSMYESGSKISDETLLNLSSAVMYSTRRGTDSLTEYKAIENRFK